MNEGILAIWNDCDPEAADDYDRWYRTEHLPERVGLPGFRYGRRYVSLSGAPEYFTFYETDSSSVLRSPAYRERLENPTAWTTRVMPHFRNMSRTVCRRVESTGTMLGGHAIAARIVGAGPLDDPALDLAGLLRGIADMPGLDHGEVWAAEADASEASGGATKEIELRGGPDQRIDAAIVIETPREADGRRIGDAIEHRLVDLIKPPATVEYGLYRLLSELRAAP